jgi:hypothetical protein
MQRKILDVKRKGTYKTIKWKDFNAQGYEVLLLLLVFKYKLNSKGFLNKYRAGICVRSNLQTTAEDTYAATLATCIFWALMTIATYFNMVFDNTMLSMRSQTLNLPHQYIAIYQKAFLIQVICGSYAAHYTAWRPGHFYGTKNSQRLLQSLDLH